MFGDENAISRARLRKAVTHLYHSGRSLKGNKRQKKLPHRIQCKTHRQTGWENAVSEGLGAKGITVGVHLHTPTTCWHIPSLAERVRPEISLKNQRWCATIQNFSPFVITSEDAQASTTQTSGPPIAICNIGKTGPLGGRCDFCHPWTFAQSAKKCVS